MSHDRVVSLSVEFIKMLQENFKAKIFPGDQQGSTIEQSQISSNSVEMSDSHNTENRIEHPLDIAPQDSILNIEDLSCNLAGANDLPLTCLENATSTMSNE